MALNRKQHIPDIAFDNFSFKQIKKLFESDKIYINKVYQRGDVWKHQQKVELIKSILNSYSIGVIVLYINDNGKFEILDGQQRLLTIYKYITGSLDVTGTGVPKFDDLEDRDQDFLNGYSIFYLKLKSHNPETKEEDIIQTFLRLQEGTALNKAEKINAYRGKFKDTFRQIAETHQMFKMMGRDMRFRIRLLCAELLLLELESDWDNLIFPGLDIDTFKNALKKYEPSLSPAKIKHFNGNLDYIYQSLNYLLTGITPRDLIAFYLLISYLRKFKADNSNLHNEMAAFGEDMLQDLNKFTIYSKEPPEGWSEDKFKKYLQYKIEARKATLPDSIKFRFNFFLAEFDRFKPVILKDKKRLHDKEQKRVLFLRQKGICPECRRFIDFRIDGSAHHVVAHKDGGRTDDLSKAVLLHMRCHEKLEKKLQK